MSPQRGDNLGGERGSDTGVSLSPSPVASALSDHSLAAGGRFVNRPRPVPSLNSRESQAASGVVRLLPVIPSPYGDDYLRTSLSTTSIIGIAAA
jgi:hypothetical protein